jgi:hypothetical protein
VKQILDALHLFACLNIPHLGESALDLALDLPPELALD